MKHERIEARPDVMGGKPVIKGTRVPVDLLVGECAHGSPEDVARLYPTVTAEDVRAALAYAADRLNADRPPHAAE